MQRALSDGSTDNIECLEDCSLVQANETGSNFSVSVQGRLE